MKDDFFILKVFIGIFIILIIGFISTGCASWDRGLKSIGSDLTGGLERNVKVYDYNGDVLAEYNGKIDLQENESKVFFDVNGKRIVCYNAIVIVEEKGVE